MSVSVRTAILFMILGGWLATLFCEGLAATFIFMAVRDVQAAPMVEPLNHPVFAEYGPNIVAGGAAQSVIHALHIVQGVFALGLLICLGLMWWNNRQAAERRSTKLDLVKYVAGIAAIAHFIYLSLYLSPRLSIQWTKMYSLDLHSSSRSLSRGLFDGLHFRSEMVIGVIALCIIAMMVTSLLSLRRAESNLAACGRGMV